MQKYKIILLLCCFLITNSFCQTVPDHKAFIKSIPLLALGTLAHPFYRLVTAFDTGIHLFAGLIKQLPRMCFDVGNELVEFVVKRLVIEELAYRAFADAHVA